ncbi:hypothetical protein Cgig2_032290 [Carnegiea gigantea]|uniref:Uncharacterized protein n=1 Tax=Carnegiea gigantea TaxID=171969 RepID=A0A9Q1GGT8_9CARY|nr:hypothetical protein Cgig2_032290 [Carnegiea gigantea]
MGKGYKVLVMGILTSNGCKYCSSWRWWRGMEIVVYVLWGGTLAESGDGKVTYEDGSRKCMVVKEEMGVEELIKMVREMTGTDISQKQLWYSLKYDREMSAKVEGDSDVKVIFKGNDEHGYLYVAENGGPVRGALESATLLGRTAEVGERVMMVYKWVQKAATTKNCESLGSEGGELPASRVRLGGIQLNC